MRGALTAAVAALLIAAIACSSSSPNTGTGTAGTGGGGATGGTGGGATQGSCQAIRLCAKDCGVDAACLATCKSRGTADAQTAWQALYDCTADTARGNCSMPAVVGLDCVCMAQCYDGLCLAETDACVAGATDLVCDMNCH